MTRSRKSKAPKPQPPAYKMTVTDGRIVFSKPPSGWLAADVTFGRWTEQVRAEITHPLDGNLKVQLHANSPDSLPNWLADIVAERFAEEWMRFVQLTVEGLRNGTIVPQSPN